MRILFCTLMVSSLLLSGCSDSGGSSGGGTTKTNGFTMSGQSVSIDGITSPSTTSMVPMSGVQQYYGRFFVLNGGNKFAGSMSFKLNKQDASSAYFSDFTILRLAQINSLTTATDVVSAPTDLNVNAVYNAGSNSVTVTNATSRFVGFNVAFGNTTYFGSNIADAGVVFSHDLSTMVGGNNSSFFFIAQKATVLPQVAVADIKLSWSLANFTVSLAGAMQFDSTSTVAVSGTGGSGLTAFKGQSPSTGAFQGELNLIDPVAGIFIFSFDSGNTGTPTASGLINGGFLMSADKNYFLGLNAADGTYFAGSR